MRTGRGLMLIRGLGRFVVSSFNLGTGGEGRLVAGWIG